MSSEHTRGLLEYGECSDSEQWIAQIGSVEQIAYTVPFEPGVARANARRLAACWNLLLPFTTEQIENFQCDVLELSAQRDELLMALKACHLELHYCSQQLVGSGWTEGETVRKALDAGRAAIAKAEGKV